MRKLTNPIRDLFEEVTNDSASWTDAIFWLTIGLVTGGVIF